MATHDQSSNLIQVPSSKFVHLHLHTQYSLLDGAITLEALVNKTKEYKMPAVAMTDHGNLFGGIEFYQLALKKGIKPILGCEMYIQSEGSRFDKKMMRGNEPYHHLVLLAQDMEGYRNLCKLITAGHLEGFYYKPRIDKEILRAHSKGLIALSGCLSGEMAHAALAEGISGAKRVAEEFRQIFDDRFYLEIQPDNIPEQKRLNDVLKQLSPALSIPLVATNDCHYLRKEDAAAHEALLCIQTGKTLQDEDRMKFSSDHFYLHSPAEMGERFPDLPGALEESFKISERCNLELDFKTYYFPKFDPPKGKTLDDYLQEQAKAGLEGRWRLINLTLGPTLKEEEKAAVVKKYEDRLTRELGMIFQMGFSGYFLIVADFINYAKSQNIPVGPGRGSAAGSLVAYCLNITDIDPLPYNLLFERFLNPERISMPDMDIDFCMNRRDEVIKYVQEKYGNVGQIITFGKMKAKAVVRDVGRVMNMPYGEVDRIAKLIPNTLNITLDEACRVESRLKEMEEKDPRVQKLLLTARSLEGLTRHASTHAAGVVISDKPLVDFMPLYRGQHDEIISQYDMKSIEKIGLIKFDFLGLKTLTVIDSAVKIIRRTRGKEIKINELPPDDPEVYKNLSTGDTGGIFQLESSGMRELIAKMKPSTFPDLIALVALYRPGPLGSGMVDEFINRKHGKIPVKYELPSLEPILDETYGVIVYQEQVMQIASVLADFSLGDADLLRRAMGKKKPEEMAEQKDKFIKGSLNKKIPQKKAEKIFDLMAKFAEYGFNKSHSAAYAYISYQTAYLKTHFTVEYMASLLTHEMGNTDKVMNYIYDCRQHGVAILPPDINESFSGFSVVGEKEIRFGLAAVKNVGEAAIESIVETRKQIGAFKSFPHFCEEIDHRKVNRRVLESLIKCGAFDSTGTKRSEAFSMLDPVLERASQVQREKELGQGSLFGMPEISHRPDAIPKGVAWTRREMLSFEKEALGFYISGHPLTDYIDTLRERSPYDTESIQTLEDGKEISFGGVVSSLREITTKGGDRMGFATIEDLKGTVSVIIFAELFKQIHPLLKGDDPIFIRGTVDVGEDAVKIVARQIVRLHSTSGNSPSTGAREVHFHLSKARVTKEQLESLKSLLKSHRGEAPAYLHLNDLKENGKGETILKLPDGLKVNPTEELVREVDRLFGTPVTVFH
jgi:DNA polymerase-3 subunit alpha